MNLAHDPATCVRCKAIVVNTCKCGRSYTAAAWKQLQIVGVQDDGFERVEYRNCECGSAICVVLGPGLTGVQV